MSVLVEVDRRGKGLSGWLEQSFDMNERHAWLRLEDAELQKGTSYIAGLLENLIYSKTR
ncbi:hypothetical protein [Paenibacillus dakarensis]|uniref:hypothetical protein n=1 Tax=Paenibacillus dakarensis TaxID=1527293 RepID=UPI000AF6ABA0|nr:hypothetical protein [Paenibacillus dakarensis]